MVFPDSKTIVKAMKQSNPSVDPFAITRDNGMNKSDSNGTTMNDMNIDWFRFQEALGKMGQMGIVDIEGKGGEHSHPLNAESMMDKFNILQKFGLLMAAFGTGFYAFGKFSKR